MGKRITSIFLIICLVAGLVPVIALADTPKTAKISILAQVEISVTEGGAAAYWKNSSYQGYTKDGKENGIGWTQVPGSESDWNLKFEYPTGGTPTLTLKDVQLDMLDDNREILYTKNADGTYSGNDDASAILPLTTNDLKIVLQGNNRIESAYGMLQGNPPEGPYFQNVTLVGENGGKLTGDGRSFCFAVKSGYDMTISNVVLDLVPSTADRNEPITIRVVNGHLLVKDSTITAGNMAQVVLHSGGDLTIENCKINATCKLTTTASAGVIYAKTGVLTINGKDTELNLEGQNNPGLNGVQGVVINDGNIKIKSPYYGIMTKAESGSIQINGGTVEISANNAFNAAPVLGNGVSGFAGLDEEDAEPYTTDSQHKKPWAKFSNDPANLPTTAPTTVPTTAPTTTPTTAPTAKPTTAPTTVPTTTPTAAPTVAPTAPVTAAPEDGSLDSTTILIAVIAVVLVVGVSAAALFRSKKK